MLPTTVELTRKELYEEIWKISVAGVAKKYGIPYAKCMAQIKAAKIPIPPSGYWTKISFGKPVEQIPFQGTADEVVTLSAEEFQRYHTPTAEPPSQPASSQEGTVRSSSDTSSPVEPAIQEPSGNDVSKPADIPPKTVQQLGKTYHVYDRETLYQEVWAMPVTEVAKRYQVSDAAIHKVCKSLDIPTPPQGYWAKLRAGKPVKQLPLPPGGEKRKLGVHTGIDHLGGTGGKASQLAFLTEEERQVALNVAAQILLPQEHARMLPEIVAHRKKITEWSKQKRQQEREFGANWNRGRRENPPLFSEGISEEQQPRVFRLIDALAKAMKPLGWQLTGELQFAMDQETVTLTFSEATDRVPHTPTKEENLELLKYEEERKKHSWASKPQIRKYDAIYNGRLSVSINGARTFRDCRSYVLEDRLGDMMLAIYEEAERLKQVRLDREEAERQRQEQERKREELRKRYNAEVDRTQALVSSAEDYETACRIRRYVSAMERAHPDQDLSEWASWARAKADWYDPTIAKEDELLGKREHGADRERKEPKHKGYWW
ncbi:hypothetical protein [uncultured Dysosmobacter sp.]|uniref:hypothetical protein n=1 Tax=uncultured Dysosmobacter sp. TaxID=2591384 RepID=UPI00260EEF70|nr:hypothetical protein [uncultured Dysosmobacter sp.]